MSTDYKFEGWVGEDESSAEGRMVWKDYEPKKWEETDVDIRVTHCGICGSDIHVLRSGWRKAPYPVVVGHEIVGVAVRVGSKTLGDFKVGDVVGVGAQSDSCLNREHDFKCAECAGGNENYCTRGVVTYASKHYNGGKSYGGYARYHRCPSHFVFKIPDGLAPQYAAPMLCGGVTVYSSLKTFGVGPGKRVGIVGVGGLGHFGVLFAKALGADKVVGISRLENKRKQALDLGCTDYIAIEDEKKWEVNYARTLDVIISTVSSPEMPLSGYLELLRLDGTLVQLGLPEGNLPVRPSSLTVARRRIASSGVGSPHEIREMLQLAVDKNIKPWVEMRPMSDANQAVVDFEAGKPRFRYVLVNEREGQMQ